jgi:hypothetical protein
MPVTTTEIKTYYVSVISDAEPNKLAATVWLFDAAGKALAFLKFISPGNALPQNEYRTDLGHPLLSFPAAALRSMVDVLRNEKPVYFTWFDYRPVRCFGSVGTSREPVGDAEQP